MGVILKPCPFCGSKVREYVGFRGLRFFNCTECGAMISFDNDFCNKNPKSTYDYWNRRVNDEHIN